MEVQQGLPAMLPAVSPHSCESADNNELATAVQPLMPDPSTQAAQQSDGGADSTSAAASSSSSSAAAAAAVPAACLQPQLQPLLVAGKPHSQPLLITSQLQHK